MKHIVFDHDGTLVGVTREGFVLFEGMLDLISRLSEKGHQLYVWTARDRFGTINSLKQNNVLGYFEDIQCANDGAYPKPSPEGLIEMLEGINKEEVVVIGDNYSDMIGAKKFGAKYRVGALWNDPLKKPVLEEFGATHLATSIDELEKLINQL
jgi:phosphoglycolate phosphatase-like HAD superfamily hydrolase